MEDFNALAAALGAGFADVRGCLIMSRDGLVLGASPQDADAEARTARVKLAALGEPERGFIQFGTETWCYVRRGPYAALAVTGIAVRPGLVIDQMEQVLFAAEEARARGTGLKFEAAASPALAPIPTSKPRTPLHPDPRPLEEPVLIHADAPATTTSRSNVEPPPGPEPPPKEPPPSPAPSAGEPDKPEEPDRSEEPTESDDVDRFSLAREFSRLLQDRSGPADG